jgi:hypothetical protein
MAAFNCEIAAAHGVRTVAVTDLPVERFAWPEWSSGSWFCGTDRPVYHAAKAILATKSAFHIDAKASSNHATAFGHNVGAVLDTAVAFCATVFAG